MYKIFIRNDNTVITTSIQRIMQRSASVDTVEIVVPKMYGDLDMSEFDCMMEYILPCSKTYKVEYLEKETETDNYGVEIPKLDENDNIIYKIPMNSEYTSEPGDIEIQFTFAKCDNYGAESQKDLIRKTCKSKITIVPISRWSDILVNFNDETGKPYPVDVLDKKLVEINIKGSSDDEPINGGITV